MTKGAVGVGGGRGMGVVFHGSSTVSRAMLVRAWRPAEPSPSTMAPTRWRPHVGAMIAIIGGDLNGDETRHRPEHAARTGAPGHTRTALPGTPTGRSRKDVPVRRHPEHEDENGSAAAVSCATGGVCCACDVTVDMPGARRSVPPARTARAVARARALSVALHKSILPATVHALVNHRPPSIPVLPSRTITLCTVVYVAVPNLAGSKNQATHTIASPSIIHVGRAKGKAAGVCPNNLDASRNHQTPAAGLTQIAGVKLTRAQGIEADMPAANLGGTRKYEVAAIPMP